MLDRSVIQVMVAAAIITLVVLTKQVYKKKKLSKFDEYWRMNYV